jgi:hypothetical protein
VYNISSIFLAAEIGGANMVADVKWKDLSHDQANRCAQIQNEEKGKAAGQQWQLL